MDSSDLSVAEHWQKRPGNAGAQCSASGRRRLRVRWSHFPDHADTGCRGRCRNESSCKLICKRVFFRFFKNKFKFLRNFFRFLKKHFSNFFQNFFSNFFKLFSNFFQIFFKFFSSNWLFCLKISPYFKKIDFRKYSPWEFECDLVFLRAVEYGPGPGRSAPEWFAQGHPPVMTIAPWSRAAWTAPAAFDFTSKCANPFSCQSLTRTKVESSNPFGVLLNFGNDFFLWFSNAFIRMWTDRTDSNLFFCLKFLICARESECMWLIVFLYRFTVQHE